MARRAFIDTQVALWLAKGDSRLSSGTLKWLNSSSETVMSALSIAELEIKAGIGKLALPKAGGFGSATARRLAQAGAKSDTVFFTADRALVALGLDWVVSTHG